MPTDPARFRPKAFPPPEFPPRRTAPFQRMPPAVFPVLLGLIGLGLALRRGLAVAGLPADPAEVVLGATVALWLFGALAYKVKAWRRFAAFTEDLRVLPGRAGLAAATMGAMAAGAAVAPHAPAVALVLIGAGLLSQGVTAVILLWQARDQPPEARRLSPVWHLNFVGFIVAGIGLTGLGWTGLAEAILWLTVPVAALIWGASLAQFAAMVPPAPLRPLLAIHVAPAALFATVAAGLGHQALAMGFAAVAGGIALVLALSLRWLLAAGFTPMWGALTFPLAALASAFLAVGWAVAGLVVLTVALAVVPVVAWRVLALWPTGRLAAVTNASEA